MSNTGMHVVESLTLVKPPEDTVGYSSGVWIDEDFEEVEWKILKRNGKKVVYGYQIWPKESSQGLYDLERM